MYLRSIEIHGFKSFANKIVFQFHNGITGIVGPNGSGKSNVADAVRWVLGEQRIKQLRGASMQDVIFSGTETRKPLSYAYVAITLDNSDHQLAIDYDEVTVARRIYRSGESEYLINGTPCRLKDVNELFYDTGIGKEGYSIIGQGQIDKILSGKPEERRELFDEAAGIVKFKRRKAAAQTKLENEKQNLVRVNDILSELEKQVGPLEKQSEVAKVYLRKKEELKSLDINVFLLENKRLREQLASAEEKYNLASTELVETGEKYEGIKEEYERIQQEIESLDAAIEAAREQLTDTGLMRGKLEGEINVLKEQINSAHGSENHLNNRKAALEEEIAGKEQEKQDILTDKKDTDTQVQEIAEAAAKAKAELEAIQNKITELNNNIEAGKNTIIGELNQRATIKSKMGRFDTMMEQIDIRKAGISQRQLHLKTEEAQQQSELERAKEKFQGITTLIQDMNAECQRLDNEVHKITDELKKQNSQMEIGKSAYHREASRLESLKNITERYDGYGNSIRKVMSNKEREKGLIGVVADIIKVDKEYEIAIETALGGSIQNIVTDNEDTAKRMIDFLKRNKFGRATFLPLTSMHGGGGIRNPEALKEPGVIGLANTLVHVESRFDGLADQLLGRTIVVDHIDHGIAIARKYRQSLRLVTLEGDLINPGGSMTGGAFKNSSNLLSRRREIEEFEKTVDMLKFDMDELEKEVVEAKNRRAACYSVIDEVQEHLREESVLENTARMNVAQVQREQLESKQRYEGFLKEQKALLQELDEINENEDSIQMELETSEKLEKELNEQIEALQMQLEKEREDEAAQMKQSEEVHLSLAGLDQQKTFIVENISRIEEEIARYAKEQEELSENRGDVSDEILRKENEIEGLKKTIEDSKDLFTEIGEEIKVQSKKREELNQQHKDFLRQREELAKHVSDLDKECFRLNSQKEGYEEASEKQMNYMWEEYELTYNHAKELRNETLTDLALMKKKIQELKNEIRKLGSVNVNAIEDYKNVSERYTFLKGQHDDLVEAEASLEQIIEELDVAMRKQFTEQFARIATEFNDVFRQLFGGGKGSLELQEDVDILEAGIRIIAQPPGKKLQNMMQLSGGEKALTAIALLFAIQNLKPSPFCLLDEIEAALDDNNVDRYAKYLHKLTKYTQFIVITHRRGTMAAADRLYGITMQEKGVSTLVSVDLLEDDLEK